MPNGHCGTIESVTANDLGLDSRTKNAGNAEARRTGNSELQSRKILFYRVKPGNPSLLRLAMSRHDLAESR
jgi:hypothetical protein